VEEAIMGRKGIEIVVSELEREQLRSMSRSRSLPHSLVRRAKIVLMAADGRTSQEIATQCEVTSPAITHWKKRFVAHGLAGLHDEVRAGRPRTHDHEAVAELLARILHDKPDGQLTGACAPLLRGQGFQRAQWPDIYRCSVYSPIVQKASSCLMIRTSWRRYGILSGCT
jgi:hypothetical protein